MLPNTAQARGLSFADLGDPGNSDLWLQPGEATATLLIAFPAGLVDDALGVASFGVTFGAFGDQTPNVQPLILVPEPSARLTSVIALLTAFLIRRVSRERAPRTRGVPSRAR